MWRKYFVTAQLSPCAIYHIQEFQPSRLLALLISKLLYKNSRLLSPKADLLARVSDVLHFVSASSLLLVSTKLQLYKPFSHSCCCPINMPAIFSLPSSGLSTLADLATEQTAHNILQQEDRASPTQHIEGRLKYFFDPIRQP